MIHLSDSHPDVRAISFLDPSGAPVRLGAFEGTTLVVQLVRYYGCLPCQVYLRALDRHRAEFASTGTRLVAYVHEGSALGDYRPSMRCSRWSRP